MILAEVGSGRSETASASLLKAETPVSAGAATASMAAEPPSPVAAKVEVRIFWRLSAGPRPGRAIWRALGLRALL